MKTPKVVLLALTFFCLSSTFAQTKYELTHSFLQIGSTPQAYKGSIEITDEYLTFTSLPNTIQNPSDTTTKVSKEKILKNKKGYFVKTLAPHSNQVAHNYTFELSNEKEEKKQGIYYITLLVASNSGDRATIFFKGKLVK